MSWTDVWDSLRAIPGMQISLLASVLVAVICAYIGVFVVLKRIVFVGTALAQISSAGIALAFLLGQSVPFFDKHPLGVALVVTLLGTLIYSQQTLSRKIPQESIIAIGYLIASSLTILLIVKTPKGPEEINELLAGSTVTVQRPDLILMAIVFFGVALVHALFYKQFLFVSFDREVAATQGYKPRVWDLVFYFVLGLTITMAIQNAGLLSVFAYMVIPAVTGLLVARRMATAFTVAVAAAVVAAVTGFLFALKLDLPPSPPTIAIGAIILSLVWASRRFVREA
jgi:ABC-type Mn2+/Zn2+ transport system permease subunit